MARSWVYCHSRDTSATPSLRRPGVGDVCGLGGGGCTGPFIFLNVFLSDKKLLATSVGRVGTLIPARRSLLPALLEALLYCRGLFSVFTRGRPAAARGLPSFCSCDKQARHQIQTYQRSERRSHQLEPAKYIANSISSGELGGGAARSHQRGGGAEIEVNCTNNYSWVPLHFPHTIFFGKIVWS